MKSYYHKILAEKYDEVSINTPDLSDAIKRKLQENPLSKIKISTHYGNIELPVVEVWTKDGTINISVDASKVS